MSHNTEQAIVCLPEAATQKALLHGFRKKDRKIPKTTSQIKNTQKLRKQTVKKNMKQYLRKLINKNSKDDNSKRLHSILNIQSEHEVVPSDSLIPSIANMVSIQELKSIDEVLSFDSGSLLSFNECISYRIIENEPQLMLSYLVLVERALNNLGLKLSSKQNEKVIKGVWNLVVKYWKDLADQSLYKYISGQIEWGLFQLLNFNLNVSAEERILMEGEIQILQE